MRRIAAALLFVVAIAGAAGWWLYRSGRLQPLHGSSTVAREVNWLDQISSHNPAIVEEARTQLRRLGHSALPTIHETLRNPTASIEAKKAALRGCAVLGDAALPALNEISTHLVTPELTVEAAVALSFLGEPAFIPLRDALASEDPMVRRESLRAIGKLYDRASLLPDAVLPLLLDGLADADPGVRLVSTTYLGIINEAGSLVVPELIEMLQDEDPEVRTAAAMALGSFGTEADMAVEALRRAKTDKDDNVAREAGVSLVRLNKQP